MSTLLHPHDADATRPLDVADVQRPPRTPRRHLEARARRFALWVLGVVAATAVLAVGLRLAHPGVLPGVTLAGSEIGGLDRSALVAYTNQLAATTEHHPVTVAHDDHLASLVPATVDYDLDADATAQAAWAVGRAGNLVTDTWTHLRALWGDTPVAAVDRVDEDALGAWVDGVADDIDRQVSNGGLAVDEETLEVTIDPPTAGAETDRPALAAAVRAALTAPHDRAVAAPVEVTPVRVDVEDVRAVATAAERVLADDVTLRVGEATATLTPRQLAPLLVLEAEGDTARLAVSAEAVAALDGVADQLTVAPVDARFDLPRTPPATLDAKGDTTWSPVDVDVRIVPGTAGREFDPAAVAGAMGEQLRAGSREVTLDLPEVEPETTTADLEALNVTELLGTFTTYYEPGQPRVVNIRHLADVLDGTVVAPGEQFSINRTSGERTCAKGYTRDGMIYNGKLIKVCGGGVSQVGTAVFNAAFFAGVQIDQHKPHSWYISRYPMGREATLDYDTDIDVKFTNDTGNGIVVRTDHSPTHLTVSLYGTSDVERVTARHGAAHNHRDAPVRYVEDPSLPPGAERVVDAGHRGFDIDVTRVTELADGETTEDTWSHRYVTSPRIVHRNSQQPSPSPSPDASEQPDGQPSEQPSPSPSPSPSGDGDGDPLTDGG